MTPDYKSIDPYDSGPEKYFYISLAPGLVKFKSTSPKNFLLAQEKLLAIKIALELTETIINMCNKDKNDVFMVLLSIQQFIFHPVINYVMFTNWPGIFFLWPLR